MQGWPTWLSNVWCDATYNPITGCTPCSPGCEHCYAAAMVRRVPALHDASYIPGSEQMPFAVPMFHFDRLSQPRHWRKPRRIFVCSMGDLFHEDVPYGWVMRVLTVMGQCPQHTFLLLTKRPHRMLDFWTRWGDLSGEDYSVFRNARGPAETRKAHPSPRGQLFADMLDTMGVPPPGCAFPTFDWMAGMQGWPTWLSNVWCGVTVCNQAEADLKIPILLATPAALRFVSIEPMLGPVDLRAAAFNGADSFGTLEGIHWVIAGGETGPGARPMHPDWARSVRDQCVQAGVPFFFKGWGNWWRGTAGRLYRERTIDWSDGQPLAGTLLDGREWHEVPEVMP
jgi:protein gp37